MKVVPFKLIGLAAAAMLVACVPVISQRGYLPDPALEARIKAGTDTKTSVQDRLGYASTTATFGRDSWYYISSTEKQVAFFTPTLLSRQILAVYFDKDGKVIGLRHFGLRDGHVIAFESRQTPARGREMTFLQQLLNATPGSSATPIQQTNPGNGGGPAPGGGIP
ncbi:MAG TPA: outer membrane protein assembly factor BamE [Rhizomicrobium sp.]|jgi:outer membrane protein assembly factor BamE (lipoprotein component of BamABCDE complex)|nr:outer membrane protein assembly factor BamE [Rhizomicrobium sp.]